MMNSESLPKDVDLIRLDGKEIYLVKTAHVSKASAELVREIITEVSPDVVALELCDSRMQTLVTPDSWKDTDLISVIRQGKGYVLAAQLTLAGFQKKVAEQLNIEPGAEMKAAISIAHEKQIVLLSIDRTIRTTLKRAWAGAGLWTMAKICGAIFGSLFSQEKFDEAQIEAMKEADALTSVMEQFSEFLPSAKLALIDERDQYMAHKLGQIDAQKIVAVVGAGHAPGIHAWLGKDIDIASLETEPPPRKLFRALAWSIPLVILGMVGYGFLSIGADAGQRMIISWILANGILAALGTAIALAHPLTILTAFVAAPITSLNPMIAAGWVAALVEAMLRKPKVKDFETIAEDCTTFRGIVRNQISKILLILVLANIGSSIGTFLGGTLLARELGG